MNPICFKTFLYYGNVNFCFVFVEFYIKRISVFVFFLPFEVFVNLNKIVNYICNIGNSDANNLHYNRESPAPSIIKSRFFNLSVNS